MGGQEHEFFEFGWFYLIREMAMNRNSEKNSK